MNPARWGKVTVERGVMEANTKKKLALPRPDDLRGMDILVDKALRVRFK